MKRTEHGAYHRHDLGNPAPGAAGSAASTSATTIDGSDIDVSVNVTDVSVGVLALSVAADETALTEVDSGDPLVRQFTGTLPTVTVTDTRPEVPDSPWYVLGTASDFVSGTDTITADHLGWSPRSPRTMARRSNPGGDIPTVVDDPGVKAWATPTANCSTSITINSTLTTPVHGVRPPV